jgi:hypothetical protein
VVDSAFGPISGRLDQLRRDYDELAVILEAASVTAPAAVRCRAADENNADVASRKQELSDRNECQIKTSRAP